MTRLAARRFPQTITRRRQSAGSFNDFGEFEPGQVVEVAFRASVQPLGVEDLDLPGGTRISVRRKVFVPVPNALAAAFGDAEADHVLIDGVLFVVEESQSWPGSHTKAVVLIREA